MGITRLKAGDTRASSLELLGPEDCLLNPIGLMRVSYSTLFLAWFATSASAKYEWNAWQKSKESVEDGMEPPAWYTKTKDTVAQKQKQKHLEKKGVGGGGGGGGGIRDDPNSVADGVGRDISGGKGQRAGINGQSARRWRSSDREAGEGKSKEPYEM